MGRDIKVSIGDDQGRGFIEAWHRAERGEAPKLPETLAFERLELLLSVLTPQRLRLLRELRRIGECSIRKLARHLECDYSNVHADVQMLRRLGLVERSERGFSVSYERISAEMNLAA